MRRNIKEQYLKKISAVYLLLAAFLLAAIFSPLISRLRPQPWLSKGFGQSDEIALQNHRLRWVEVSATTHRGSSGWYISQQKRPVNDPFANPLIDYRFDYLRPIGQKCPSLTYLRFNSSAHTPSPPRTYRILVPTEAIGERCHLRGMYFNQGVDLTHLQIFRPQSAAIHPSVAILPSGAPIPPISSTSPPQKTLRFSGEKISWYETATRPLLDALAQAPVKKLLAANFLMTDADVLAALLKSLKTAEAGALFLSAQPLTAFDERFEKTLADLRDPPIYFVLRGPLATNQSERQPVMHMKFVMRDQEADFQSHPWSRPELYTRDFSLRLKGPAAQAAVETILAAMIEGPETTSGSGALRIPLDEHSAFLYHPPQIYTQKSQPQADGPSEELNSLKETLGNDGENLRFVFSRPPGREFWKWLAGSPQHSPQVFMNEDSPDFYDLLKRSRSDVSKSVIFTALTPSFLRGGMRIAPIHYRLGLGSRGCFLSEGSFSEWGRLYSDDLTYLSQDRSFCAELNDELAEFEDGSQWKQRKFSIKDL